MRQENPDINRILQGLKNRSGMLDSIMNDESFLRRIETVIEHCQKVIEEGGKIMICGNGGFAAIAQHTATELLGKLNIKRSPISAIALGTDMSAVTCIANDFGFEHVFSRQIEALGKYTDLLIVLTTSGKSKNLLQALSQAKEQKIISIAFTGKDCGTLCRELGAYIVELPSNDAATIQDLTMVLLHLICGEIERNLYPQYEEETKEFWIKIIDDSKKENKNILILDRDGVINHLLPNDYVITEKDLIVNKEFLSVCRSLKETFERIFIVTNQAVIGKGIASEEDVKRINSIIIKEIQAAGGRIDSIYISPDASSDSPLRKPNIGMAKRIIDEYPEIDLNKSIMIGDSYSDELFAQRLNIRYYNLKNILK